MTVLIYVDTSKQVGEPDHLKVFANADAAEKWIEENEPRRRRLGEPQWPQESWHLHRSGGLRPCLPVLLAALAQAKCHPKGDAGQSAVQDGAAVSGLDIRGSAQRRNGFASVLIHWVTERFAITGYSLIECLMTGVGEHGHVVAHFDRAHFKVFKSLGLPGVTFVRFALISQQHPAGHSRD